jgi:hypothetical protein
MSGLRAKQLIIVSMTTNPYPNQIISNAFNCQSSKTQANSSRPKPADPFEME